MKRKTTRIAAQLLGIVLFIFAPTEHAAADSPILVKRTFGVLVNPGFTPPDFLAKDSNAVVVIPDTSKGPDPIQFTSCQDCAGDLAGTFWLPQTTFHAVRGGDAEEGHNFYWWVDPDDPQTFDPPPVGAHTMTGDGSPFIISQTTVRIETCGTVCGPGEDGSYRLSPFGSHFVIVTAWFIE